MDLLALSDFNLVAEHGGVGSASRASRRPKATLSRHLQELEQDLGVRLVERGARTIRLTEEGRDLHARTRSLLNDIISVGQEVSGSLAEPHGVLRVSAPLLFSHVLLGRLAADFVAEFPKVLLEVTVENRLVDLVEEGYDLVIRANPSPSDELIGRCFLREKMLIVAPLSLGRPEAGLMPAIVPAVVTVGDRKEEDWRYSKNGSDERLTPRPVLRLASMLMVRDAACAGAGAALLPESIVRQNLDEGSLVSWGEASQPTVEIWALHTSRRLVSRRVQAFFDFLCRSFA